MSSTPVGAGPGPATGQPPSGGNVPNAEKFKQILAAFSEMVGKTRAGLGGGGGQQGGVATPATVPQATPPGPIPGPLGASGNAPGAAPPVTPNQPQFQPMPPQPAYASGFNFPNRQARDMAITTNAIQSISDLVQHHNQRKEAQTQAKAENIMLQVHNAQDALAKNPDDPGAKMTLDMLMSDPKAMKIVEKGLNEYFEIVGQQPNQPGPEAKGFHGFLQKLKGEKSRIPDKLNAPNTPGGIAMPSGGPDIMTRALMDYAKQNPDALKAAAAKQITGSVGGAKEAAAQESVKGGTKTSADVTEQSRSAKEIAQMNLEAERLRMQQKGNKVLVSGPNPIIQDSAGREWSVNDKDAPPDIQKAAQAEKSGWYTTQDALNQRESRREAATMARFEKTLEDKDKARGIKLWAPTFDARKTLGVMDDNAEKAKKGDLQAQRAVVSAHVYLTFRSAGGRPTQMMFQEASKASPLLQQLQSQIIWDKDGNFVDIARTTALTPQMVDQMQEMAKTAYSESYRSAKDQSMAWGLDIPKDEYMKDPSKTTPIELITGPDGKLIPKPKANK